MRLPRASRPRPVGRTPPWRGSPKRTWPQWPPWSSTATDPDRILTAGLRWTAAGSIVRIAAGRRLDRFAANDQVLCGPELAVAFYRRSALEAVETLRHYGSDLATALDLALAIRTTGYRSVQEPACVTTATGDIARLRRRLAGRRSPRTAFPWLGCGSRLETLVGRTCRAAGDGVSANSVAALDLVAPRRPLLGGPGFGLVSRRGDRPADRVSAEGDGASSAPLRHCGLVCGPAIAGGLVPGRHVVLGCPTA